MTRAELARAVETAHFATTRVAAGYEARDVDDFLDRLASDLHGETPDAAILASVDAAHFRPARLRAGYAVRPVDALLERVTSALGAARLALRGD